MGLTRIISALAMGISGWMIISTPLYAASTINYRIEQDSCPIIADRRFSASPSYLCQLRTTNSGSVISWLARSCWFTRYRTGVIALKSR